ncbi:MAG: hypothetical protein NDI61_13295 [Bdellovibrionaceae bacterium]|nr:hypothetical protein [Pseudobdellovibrionaceae bacterium]
MMTTPPTNNQMIHPADTRSNGPIGPLNLSHIDSTEVLANLDRRLQDLLGQAPSDSTATLTVVHSHNTYRSLLTLQFTQGRACVGMTSQDFSTMVDRLFEAMRAKLRERRKSRTQTPGE